MTKPKFLGNKPKEIDNENSVQNQLNNSDYIKKYNIFVEDLYTKQSKFHINDTVIIDNKHDKYPNRVGKLLLGGCDSDSLRVLLKDSKKVDVEKIYITKISKIDYIKGE